MTIDVLIIGAGPAGLAAAYELKQLGIIPTIIEKESVVGMPWRKRHEQLCLNTHRNLSNIPGLKMPRDYPDFPSRDQFIKYLEDYIDFLDIPIDFGVEALEIEVLEDSCWKVTTNKETLLTQHIIVSTGSDKIPFIPDWPNKENFTGELIHAGEFRHAKDYIGKSVLLVGAGNSGVDIGNHLAREAIKPSWMSVRTGTWVAPKDLFGIPLQPLVIYAQWLPAKVLDLAMAIMSRILYGDLTKLGLPKPPKGAATRQIEDNYVPSLNDGFIESVKTGLFSFVPEIKSFNDDSVELIDGQILQADAVICATGYRLGLEDLLGKLGLLNKKGFPAFLASRETPGFHGLWFLGLNTSLYGNFYIRRKESKNLARKIKTQLKN